MTDRTAAQRQANRHRRMKEAGFTRVQEWVPAEKAQQLRQVAEKMRKAAMTIRNAAEQFTNARNLAEAQEAYDSLLQLLADEHPEDADIESAAQEAIQVAGVDYINRINLLREGILVGADQPDAEQFVAWLQAQGWDASIGASTQAWYDSELMSDLWVRYSSEQN